MFDPATGTWTPLAISHNPRTYHNTAALLPDGRSPDRRPRADLDAVR